MRSLFFHTSSIVVIALLILLISPGTSKAQGFYIEDDSDVKHKWEDYKPVKLPENFEDYSAADLVILDEKTEFSFYVNNARFDIYPTESDLRNNGKIIRHLLIKINNEQGVNALKSYRLPDSFDQARDVLLYKQGRRKRINIPFTQEYRITEFVARKFTNRWEDVTVKDHYDQIRCIRGTGEFADENVKSFDMLNIHAGDVVEIYYLARFKSNYGTNLFYFNSSYPKLKCEYDFTYRVQKSYANYSYILPLHIADSLVTKTYSLSQNDYTQTDKIVLHNLPGINYPANSIEGNNLPHVYADFDFQKIIVESFPDPTRRVYDYKFIRPKNFEWMINTDTVNHYTKIYDKHFAAIRKFVSTLPPIGNDSANAVFFKALCDTFNEFRYLSMNHLFYNESNLYNVSSGDHLLKRRLAGHTWNLYRDILNDNNIFYYLVNVQDKRYGEHNPYYRAHYAYEGYMIAIPRGDGYIYFMPRYDGVKYHLNELPFYYEGIIGSMKPQNFQSSIKDKENSFSKFIRTHKGTYNENTRTENATVKISLDSLKAGIVNKESLSGQFSTVLRHIYLNDYIDSTIAPHYFKKCTAKPGATDVKIKLSSKITQYPFRYTFNCSEHLKLRDKKSLSLEHWFSFVLSKENFPELPTHDYYFDFEFSDSYNFMLDFSSPVEIKNAAAFTKNIDSELFTLESEIEKKSESAYLLRVKVLVKQAKVPKEKAGELMDLVKALDELNDFSIELAGK